MKTLLTLVGIQHRPSGLEIMKTLKADTPVVLLREPHNKHDPNAIQVLVPIGYIKATQAKDLTRKLDFMLNKDMEHGVNVWPATLARNEGTYGELEIEEPEA